MEAWINQVAPQFLPNPFCWLFFPWRWPAVSGQWLYGATLLFVYALGRGIPIILVGTFTGLITRMDSFARWNNIMEKVAGIIIIVMGGYFAYIP